MKPIIVFGMPRSGSTWFAKNLALNQKTRYIHEPDDEKKSYKAFFAKLNIHRYPLVDLNIHRKYYLLWKDIIDNGYGNERMLDKPKIIRFLNSRIKLNPKYVERKIGNKTGNVYFKNLLNSDCTDKKYMFSDIKVMIYKLFFNFDIKGNKKNTNDLKIIKSVHSILMVNKLGKKFNFIPILLIRNPFSLIASYKRMNFPDGYRNILYNTEMMKWIKKNNISLPITINTTQIMIRDICLIYLYVFKEYPKSNIVYYEDFADNPVYEFKKIYSKYSIPWTSSIEKQICSQNQSGKGMELNRISINQIDSYKNELSLSEINDISNIIAFFGFKMVSNKIIFVGV